MNYDINFYAIQYIRYPRRVYNCMHMKKIISILILLVALSAGFFFVSDHFEKDSNAAAISATASSASSNKSAGPKVLSDADILKLADNKLADGTVPVGDNKYVTTGAKKGYIYLCNARKDNPGSMVNGPWMSSDGKTWNFLKKITVDGNVTWKNAKFSNTLSGLSRILSTNSLPINHTTGVFPVARTDDAAAYDPNPNTISAQNIVKTLTADPAYSNTPYCMGGEVGIMLTGVALFNGFDAGLRDAAAHELQDTCDGHPQGSGEYHYHSLSSCIKDTNYKTVIGYAYDGFPITGPMVAKDKYLMTEDLDECHGITSEIIVDGKKKTTYHYVMTRDFPYSASCFRAKPVSTGPTGTQGAGQSGQGGANGASQMPSGANSQQGQAGNPPQEALTACSAKAQDASCSFTGGRGEAVSGICKLPPNSSALACVPMGM